MRARIVHPDPSAEFETGERCHILESWNVPEDRDVSIARARVSPGVRTRLHTLDGIVERYLVVEGRGRVEVGGLPPEEVGPGDVVVIPADTPQRIENVGSADLVFYCICSPAFDRGRYREME